MKTVVLLLSMVLVAGSATAQSYANVPAGGVLSKGPLPDMDAFTADGKPLKVRALCRGKYTVLSAGCLTCPLFHQNYPEIEAAAADYTDQGVQFFYFYKSLRHPELNGYVPAQNLKERLLQLAAARKQLGTHIPWIADTLDDSMRIGLKAGSWSVYLISPEGEIIYAASRIDAPGLRNALTQAVGPIATPTSASSLNLPRVKRAPKLENNDSELGVKRPEGLSILSITPEKPEETYYVKLRAEADDALIRTGTGRLFLGFYPDPILDAHWNNLAPPMKFSLTLADGATATPSSATAKKGSGDSDTLPRQFWVDIQSATPGGSIELKLNYFGCTSTLCMALTHQYTIQLAPLNDGSRTYGMNKGKRNSKRTSTGGSNRMARMDSNKDGAISFEEMYARTQKQRGTDSSEQQTRRRFNSLDTNKDGSLSAEELEKAQRK